MHPTGRKIADLDADAEVTLVYEAQERNDDNLMFDTGVFDEEEIEVEKVVSTAEVTTASVTTTTVDKLTLAQTLIEIKAAKPKAVTTAATTTTTVVTTPKARGVVVKEPTMMEADYELAQRLQAEEQGELTIEERSKLFIELIDKRKKHFAKLKAEEIRRKPPTKTQKRNQICTYLKNIANYKHSQLKNKNFEEIQMLFENCIKWVDSFVPIDSEVVKGGKEKDEGSVTRVEESSSKRASIDLQQEIIKKQKIDDDQEEAEMKKHMEIVVDEEEIAVDAIPLATDGSSRRYSSMIRILQNIDREDLETLWKLVKAKHGNTRPEEAYERVLWGDLKVMFKPDVESEVWRNLQGYNVTVWKLFSSSGGRIVGIKRLLDDLGVNTAKSTRIIDNNNIRVFSDIIVHTVHCFINILLTKKSILSWDQHTMSQNLQVQVEELKSVNKSLNLSVEELYKARALAEETLREIYEMISTKYEKYFTSKETENLTDEIKSLQTENQNLKSRESELINLEKLASQNYTSLQKENNDLRTSYNVLKEKYETSCEQLEKENNDLKMHYKRLFDSIKQKKVDSQVFTKSIPKVNDSKKIHVDKKYLKKQHSSETFSSQNHVKNESSKQAWKRKENISKPLKYSRSEMFSMRKRDDFVLKKVKDIAGSTFAWNYFSRISTLSSDNQSLLLQYSRDRYVIEGELKEYEDSCEKSSIQFEDKDFIQEFLKTQVTQKKIKLAFENVDLSSRVELMPSEIKRSILLYTGRKLYQEIFATRGSLACEKMLVIGTCSVAGRMKDRKCRIKGSTKPPVKRKVVHAGSSSRGHLDNQLDAELLNLHDHCYAREKAREKEFEELKAKCDAAMVDFDNSPAINVLRQKIKSLSDEVKEHKATMDRMLLESKK
ncbi:hypothetical protein Tco_0729901 [Tanacetum coccineum]|uniref:Uncharacterized protein n=1 Tax=Tanacetum coccineum TaxID=301880 RepID=A0ABQ4YSP7_9ASTR